MYTHTRTSGSAPPAATAGELGVYIYMYIYIYIYMYIDVYTYIYIYIYTLLAMFVLASYCSIITTSAVEPPRQTENIAHINK